jgi:hypothetical protein
MQKLALIYGAISIGSAGSAFAACSSDDSTAKPADAGTDATADAAHDVGPAETGGGDSSRNTSPTVRITSPTTGGQLDVTAPTLGVQFSVTNFALKSAGTCGTTAACGHVWALVDGAKCNDSSGGDAGLKPYNASGFQSPITLDLSFCPGWPKIDGIHTISLELHADDESAVKDGTGKTISDSVDVDLTVTVDGGTDANDAADAPADG